MRVSFPYAALVEIKRRSTATPLRHLVRCVGEAEITELSSSEVPVAAVVPSIGAKPTTEILFHDGRLYGKTLSSDFSTAASGTDRAVAWAICERLLKDKVYDSMVGSSAGRDVAKKYLWSLWSDRRMFHGLPRDIRGFSPDILFNLGGFDQRKFHDDMIGTWEQVALDYVSSLILVDGRIWRPIDEPMLRSDNSSGPQRYVLDDTSAYLNAYGRRWDLPSPYAPEGFAERQVSEPPPYWLPSFSYRPFIDAEELASQTGEWLGEVRMPEAFTFDHGQRLLDRAARVAASWVALSMKQFRFDGQFGEALASHVRSIKRVTPNNPDGLPAERLIPALSTLSNDLDYIRSSMGPIVKIHIDKSGIRDLVSDAIDQWQDRPVNLAATSFGHQPSTRSLGMNR